MERRMSSHNVPTVRLVCMGLNAPALFFKGLDPLLWSEAWDWGWPRSVLGFDTGDLFFLFGVAVVWTLCGFALDHRSRVRAPKSPTKAIAAIGYAILGGIGAILFVGA